MQEHCAQGRPRYRRRMSTLRPMREIPGPKARFLVGELPTFKKSMPWLVCATYAREFGPITRIKVLGNKILVLNDPQAIAEALDVNRTEFYKERPREAILPIGTDASPFISPGGDHWKQRSETSAHSHREFFTWLSGRLPDLQRHIERTAATLEGKDFAAMPTIFRLTFDLFSLAFAGRVLGDDAFESFKTLSAMGDDRIRWRLPFAIPHASKIAAEAKRWHDFFRAIVAETRANPDSTDNVIKFQLKNGGQLDDETLAVELANTYFGGCFSVSSGVVNTLYKLTQHPEQMQTVAAEALRMRQAGELTQARALHASEAIDFAIREALRLLPPVSFFVRRVHAKGNAQLAGYEVDAGTTLFISCYALQRSAAHFGPDAEEFRPQRWGNGVAKTNPYGSAHFFPFGRGPRSCGGEASAHILMKLMLTTLLANYTVQVGVNQSYDPELFFAVMRPKGLTGKLVKRPAVKETAVKETA